MTANCAHPGLVRTRFGREARLPMRVAVTLARPFMLSPRRGARTTIYLATSDQVAGATGGYYVKCRQREPSPAARDEAGRPQAVAAQRGTDRPHPGTPRDIKRMLRSTHIRTLWR